MFNKFSRFEEQFVQWRGAAWPDGLLYSAFNSVLGVQRGTGRSHAWPHRRPDRCSLGA